MTAARPTPRYDTCNQPKRQGEGNCTRPAGWGTDHAGVGACKLHGGSTPSHRKAAAVTSARQRLTELTARPLTPEEFRDPMRGLWEHYTEMCLAVDFLRDKVMALTEWTGDIYSLDRFGEKHATSEEARAYVRLLQETWVERRKASEACIKAGIADRMSRIEEEKFLLIANAYKRAILAADLSPQQRKSLEQSIGSELRLLATSN